MHILFVTEFFPDLKNPIISGGVESRIYYTARSLAKTHHVTVIARRKHTEPATQTQDLLTIHRLGSPTNTAAASISSLIGRFIFTWQAFFKGLSVPADIVEGSNFVVYLPAFFVGVFKRIPKVSWYPDVLIGKWSKQFGYILGTVGELAERISIKLPWDHLITISQPAQKRLKSINVNDKKISIIPCGVDLNHQLKVSKESQKFNQLLVISRLVPYKRVDMAIDLMHALANPDQEQLSDKTQNWVKINQNLLKDLKLVIIGSGPQQSKLKKKISHLKLKNRVIFKHDVDTKQLHYELLKSKLLIHPSLIEGFGIVLVEAAAYGTPFIAANIPTSKSLAKSLKSGETFKKNDFDQLVEKTVTLLADTKKYHQLQQHAKANIPKYDCDKLSEQTAEVYKSLLPS